MTDQEYNDLIGWAQGEIAILRQHYMPDIFTDFQKRIEENKDVIISRTTSRWLVSIVDTYADYGTPLEKSNACIILSFVNTVRLYETMDFLRDSNDLNQKKMANFRNYWPLTISFDGLHGLHLYDEDTLVNMMIRIRVAIRKTEFLQGVWEELIKRFKKNDPSVLTYLNWGSKESWRIYPLDVYSCTNTPWKDENTK